MCRSKSWTNPSKMNHLDLNFQGQGNVSSRWWPRFYALCGAFALSAVIFQCCRKIHVPAQAISDNKTQPETVIYHGQPWATMVRHEKPWSTMDYYVSSFFYSSAFLAEGVLSSSAYRKVPNKRAGRVGRIRTLRLDWCHWNLAIELPNTIARCPKNMVQIG